MHSKQKKYFISFKLIIFRPDFRKYNISEHTNESEIKLVVANIKTKLRKDHNIVVKWTGSFVKIRLIMRSEWRPYKLLTNFQWRCSNLSYPISRFAPHQNVISHNRNPVKKYNYRHCCYKINEFIVNDEILRFDLFFRFHLVTNRKIAYDYL